MRESLCQTPGVQFARLICLPGDVNTKQRGHSYKLTHTHSEVPPLESSVPGKRTQTLSKGLIRTISPSANPTHTVRQHNGPFYSHSRIPLTPVNRNNAREGDDPVIFSQLPLFHLCSFNSSSSFVRRFLLEYAKKICICIYKKEKKRM